jgi:putative acetyltransferase
MGMEAVTEIMKMQLSEMKIEHYEAVIMLWKTTEGIGLSSADSREAIASYLARNPGLSLVALDDERVAGALLCGHDGRRGFIHHLAVAENYRRQDLGREMVERALVQLRLEGIEKCHLFVFDENHGAISFWKQVGFTQRPELSTMSRMTGEASSP